MDDPTIYAPAAKERSVKALYQKAGLSGVPYMCKYIYIETREREAIEYMHMPIGMKTR
jgi:hypothetical protein